MASLAPLALLVAFAAAISATTGVLTWRRRQDTPAALPLTAALASVTLWGVAVVLLNSGIPRPWLDLVVIPQFAAIGGTVLSLRLFVDSVSGRPLGRRRTVALSIEPVLLVVVVALDPWFHWFHGSVDYLDGRRVPTAGPLFWVHTGYSYLIIVGAAFTIWQLRRTTSGLLRRQATTILLAIAAPFAANLAVVFAPPVDVDITPVAFAVTGVLFAYAVLQQDLLRLVPVARSLVVDTVTDAVFVIDARERLVDLNPAGRVLLGRRENTDVVGRTLSTVVDPALAGAVGDGEGELVVALANGKQVDVRTRWIRDERGREFGRVVVVRDVSEQLAARAALEAANETLRAHVATIEKLQADLAIEAARDPLTGLRNRRRFVDDLTDRLLASTSAGTPMSLVLLDVDRFKAINDTHGHAVGDEVLVGVARALGAHARPEDLVRYGGEEFVVLLPRLGTLEARARAEVLRAACADVRVSVEGLRVTISAGVATSPDHGATPDELLLAADRALYEAKEGGRDQVALAD